MESFKIAKGIEELIHDMTLWTIVYPYTMARILLRPLTMMRYIPSEVARPDEDRFADSISPALFLCLTIVLGWAGAAFDVIVWVTIAQY